MRYDLLTREQAVAIVGADAVDRVDREHCEPTNYVGVQGAGAGDDVTEWAASVRAADGGRAVTLTAYYYTSTADDEAMYAADGDGSVIDWQIAGYESE